MQLIYSILIVLGPCLAGVSVFLALWHVRAVQSAEQHLAERLAHTLTGNQPLLDRTDLALKSNQVVSDRDDVYQIVMEALERIPQRHKRELLPGLAQQSVIGRQAYLKRILSKALQSATLGGLRESRPDFAHETEHGSSKLHQVGTWQTAAAAFGTLLLFIAVSIFLFRAPDQTVLMAEAEDDVSAAIGVPNEMQKSEAERLLELAKGGLDTKILRQDVLPHWTETDDLLIAEAALAIGQDRMEQRKIIAYLADIGELYEKAGQLEVAQEWFRVVEDLKEWRGGSDGTAFEQKALDQYQVGAMPALYRRAVPE